MCQKCGYCFTGYNPRPWRYYRCSGTDRSKFHGQLRCDARLLAVEPLEAAVWDEVCRLLREPARVLEEYQRRLDALSGGPRRHELDAVQRQGDKLRRAIDRLIDGFAEGLIAKHEFEPRIAQLRQRTARLEAEAQALRSAAEQARSLQLVIGKLSVFAEMVRDRLEAADWDLRREIVCTLIKRIEVTDDVVRVVFRVEPGGSGLPEQHPALRYCQARRRAAPHAGGRHALRRRARRRDGLKHGRNSRGFGRSGHQPPGARSRRRDDGSGQAAQAQAAPRDDDRALLDWPTRSPSDPIRWRPCADPDRSKTPAAGSTLKRVDHQRPVTEGPIPSSLDGPDSLTASYRSLP